MSWVLVETVTRREFVAVGATLLIAVVIYLAKSARGVAVAAAPTP
jgi:hypothetical protein